MSPFSQRLKISLCLASPLLAIGCDTRILSKLDESEANRALVVLEREGLAAKKEKAEGSASPTFHIRVPDQSATKALHTLAREGIPKKRRHVPELGRSHILATRDEFREQQRQTLSKSLEQTLQSLASVVEASVHLALATIPRSRNQNSMLQESSLPGEQGSEDRASVLLRTRKAAGENISDAEVRRLVAGTVPTLKAENVVVVRIPIAHSKRAKVAHESVGPFSISKKQAPLLRAILLGSLIANLLLAAGLLFTKLRSKIAGL